MSTPCTQPGLSHAHITALHHENLWYFITRFASTLVVLPNLIVRYAASQAWVWSQFVCFTQGPLPSDLFVSEQQPLHWSNAAHRPDSCLGRYFAEGSAQKYKTLASSWWMMPLNCSKTLFRAETRPADLHLCTLSGAANTAGQSCPNDLQLNAGLMCSCCCPCSIVLYQTSAGIGLQPQHRKSNTSRSSRCLASA